MTVCQGFSGGELLLNPSFRLQTPNTDDGSPEDLVACTDPDEDIEASEAAEDVNRHHSHS